MHTIWVTAGLFTLLHTFCRVCPNYCHVSVCLWLENASNWSFFPSRYPGICRKHGRMHFPNFVNSQGVFTMLMPANKGFHSVLWRRRTLSSPLQLTSSQGELDSHHNRRILKAEMLQRYNRTAFPSISFFHLVHLSELGWIQDNRGCLILNNNLARTDLITQRHTIHVLYSLSRFSSEFWLTRVIETDGQTIINREKIWQMSVSPNTFHTHSPTNPNIHLSSDIWDFWSRRQSYAINWGDRTETHHQEHNCFLMAQRDWQAPNRSSETNITLAAAARMQHQNGDSKLPSAVCFHGGGGCLTSP